VEEIMETLLDYIFETKRWSYIVAMILMVGAIPFWRFLVEREKKSDDGVGTHSLNRRST
jgi:hypothetical protein